MKNILYLLILLLATNEIASAQWTKVYPQMSGIHNISLKGDTVFATIWGKGIAYSSDKGITWDFRNSGLGSLYAGILGINGDDIYVSAADGIYYSSNFGESWNKRNTGIEGKLVQQFCFDNNTIYAATNKGFFTSKDRALIWTSESQGIGERVVSACYKDEDGTLYAGVLYDGLYIKGAGDTVWVKQNLGIDTVNISTIIINNNIIYLATENNNLLYLENNGEEWKSYTIGNGLDILDLKIYKDRLFAAVYNTADKSGGLYYSKDFGQNWIQKNEGLASYNMRHIAINDEYIYSAVWISGIYRSPIEEYLPVYEENNLQSGIFPNPSSHIINLSGFINGKGRIYSYSGELIQDINFVNGKADIQRLPTGRYIIEYNNKTYSFIKKQ